MSAGPLALGLGCRVETGRGQAADLAGCYVLDWSGVAGAPDSAATPDTVRLSPIAQPVGRADPGSLGLRLEALRGDSSGGHARSAGAAPDWARRFDRRGWHYAPPDTAVLVLASDRERWTLRLRSSGDSLAGQASRHARDAGGATARGIVVARRLPCEAAFGPG